MITLVDRDRQWFKAAVGIEGVSETPRDISFCSHAVESGEMLVVDDATKDARFAENPLVLGDPNIRFYAGAPLIDRDGFALGTLCAIGREPQVLTERQREALIAAATGLARLIEARKGVPARSLEQLSLLTEALESAPDPIVLLRVADRTTPPIFTYANRAFSDLFGYELDAIVGRPISMMTGPRTDKSKTNRLQNAVKENESGTEVIVLYTAAGAPRVVELRERSVNATHRIASFRDLTRLQMTQQALATTNQRLFSLLANNNDAVLTVDRSGECLDVNTAACDLFGYSRQELLGFGFLAAMHRGIFPGNAAFPDELIAGEPIEYTTTYEHREGRALNVECKAVPMIVDGTTEGAYVIAKDVTERRRLTELVTEQAKRTHALYMISATIATGESEQIDAALRLASDSLEMEFGYVAEARGLDLCVVNAVGDPLLTVGQAIPLHPSLERGPIGRGEILALEDMATFAEGHSSREFPGWHGYIAAPIYVGGKVSGAIGLVSRRMMTFTEYDKQFMRLISALVSSLFERQIQQARLDRLAFSDHLTELPNRARFMSSLDTAVFEGSVRGLSFALHFVDLDGFKTLNDAAGHHVGDLALQEAGRRLEQVTRETDLPARLGGDEFVVLQGGIAGRDDAKGMAERLVQLLCEPYVLGGTTYRLSASVGVAIFPDDGDEARSLLQRADAALYNAKALGKNRVEFYAGKSAL